MKKKLVTRLSSTFIGALTTAMLLTGCSSQGAVGEEAIDENAEKIEDVLDIDDDEAVEVAEVLCDLGFDAIKSHTFSQVNGNGEMKIKDADKCVYYIVLEDGEVTQILDEDKEVAFDFVEAAEEEEERKEKEKEEKAEAKAKEEEQEVKEQKEETEKKEEKTEETEAATEETKAATEAPAELSDDLYDFQVSVEGTVYQFPMWYSDFEALGWEYEGDNTRTLTSNQYTLSERWKKDGVSVYTKLANLSMNSVEYADSMVASFNMDRFEYDECGWEIILPGGIQWGVSNIDDIIAAYGKPSSDYDGDLYYKMTYTLDTYSEISLYVYKDTNALEGIEIENIVELEGADNSVDTTVPDIVKNYVGPTELGDDWYSFDVELEGNLYRLPCPVSVFLENGFELDKESAGMAIGAGSYGWVNLRYNNQELRCMVENYADYATISENCFVTGVESNDYGADFELILPGGIKRGDTEEALEEAIADFNYEKEIDESYNYYSIYNPDGSTLDGYEIIVREGVVDSIEVENQQKPE